MTVPADEHFVPLLYVALYVAGLAEVPDRPALLLVDGYFGGTASRTSDTLDIDCPRASTTQAMSTAAFPDPDQVLPVHEHVTRARRTTKGPLS